MDSLRPSSAPFVELPENIESLSDEDMRNIFNRIPIQQLMQIEKSPNETLNRNAKHIISSNISTYIRDNNLPDKVKETVLTSFYASYDFNKDYNEGFKLLASNGNIDLINKLIAENKWDPNNEAITWASERGLDKVVKLLLDSGKVDPTDDNNYAIKTASEKGHDEVVKLLLNSGEVDPAASVNYAIKCASENGHDKVVKLLLDSGKVDPAASQNYAIRHASEKGHDKVVKLLLDSGKVDPAADDNVAIRNASKWGHDKVVKLLLDSGKVDPAADNNDAIRIASLNDHDKVVKLLLDSGKVDPTAEDNWGNSPLNIASLNGHDKVVKLLLDSGKVDPAVNDNWAIRNASENGHDKVVKLLLDSGKVDPAVNDNWAIRNASKKGHDKVVKLLLDSDKADPAAGDNDAIRMASKKGHGKVVKLLLDSGKVDPAADDNNAIRKASENGHDTVVKLLLDSDKVDPTVGDNDAIRMASQKGHDKVVKLLLDSGKVDPAASYNYAIRNASKNGHDKVVKLLLDSGKVDPAALMDEAIIGACENGHDKVVKLLLDSSKVDPAAKYNNAIINASINGHDKVVKLLLDSGKVDPSANDNWAIRNASKNGHDKVVKLLLDSGKVDPAADDNSAIRKASSGGHDKLVKLLLDSGKVDPAARGDYAIKNASAGGHEKVVKLLLDSGKVDAAADGNFAIKSAAANGHSEVVKILLAQPTVISTLSIKDMFKDTLHIDVVKLLLDKDDKLLYQLDTASFLSNIASIITILGEKAKPYLLKAANESFIEYTDLVLSKADLLNKIQKLFPFDKPENADLIPIKIEINGEMIRILTSIVKPLASPQQVLKLLTKKLEGVPKISFLSVSYNDSPGADAGGLSRQFVSQLFSGLISQNPNKLKFNPQEEGFLPEIALFEENEEGKIIPRKLENLEEYPLFKTLGKFLGLALTSNRKPNNDVDVNLIYSNRTCPVGNIFSLSFFDHILSLNPDEVNRETPDFISQLSTNRLLELYTPLIDKNNAYEGKVLQSLKNILAAKDIQNVTGDIDLLVSLAAVVKDPNKTLADYQNESLEAYRPNFLSKIAACHALAHELNQALPITTTVEGSDYTLNSWDDIEYLSSKVLMDQIQGILNKEDLKRLIKVKFQDSNFENDTNDIVDNVEQIEQNNAYRKTKLKQWIDEWIDKQPPDLSTIKNFLRVITGAPSVSTEINFKITSSPELKGLYAHTCHNSIDVPVDSLPALNEAIVAGTQTEAEKKDTIHALFNAWGSGIGVTEITHA